MGGRAACEASAAAPESRQERVLFTRDGRDTPVKQTGSHLTIVEVMK
jgi:hypothetical protein